MGFKEKSVKTFARILLKANEQADELDQNGKKVLYPCFEVKKDDKKFYYPVFEGRFISIEEGSYHSETLNKDVELVKITFDCDGEEIVISASWTGVMRNIVNSLAGCKVPLENISIGLYSKIVKDREYPNVWIKNNKERTERLISIDEQNKLKKVITDPDTKEVIKVKWDLMEEKLRKEYDNINGNRKATEEDLPF